VSWSAHTMPRGPIEVCRITELLSAAGSSWTVQVVDEVGSTSDELRHAGLRGEAHGTVLFAESQTAGRGQRSNRWVAPVGLDLMFSVLLRPTVPMALWPRLTTLAALAICRGIETAMPLRPTIKWPNDIYAGQRKVSGLLAETFHTAEGAFLVLGIGINVNSQSFPAELGGTATSLLQQMPASVQWIERETLAAAILLELQKWMECWDESFGIALEEVRQRSLLLGRDITATLQGQPIQGKAAELDDEGHLILQQDNGERVVLSSAIEVRLA
jgi:BirA family transcriptional regulator, biotin operon repressor / biotin---[acetyl-CoA-carboxylase] ligase